MATGTTKYFNGTIELTGTWTMTAVQFRNCFYGVQGIDNSVGKNADGKLLPVTRIIDYKINPSLHKCGGKCLNAVGKLCECACGGKNHGANQ